MIGDLNSLINSGMFVLGATFVYGITDTLLPYFKFGEGNNIQNIFDNTLKNINYNNITNKNGVTFKLKKVKRFDNGFYSELIIPYGLNLEQLQNILPTLKQHLYMDIELKTNNKKHFIYFYNLEDNIPFKAIKMLSNEINLGLELNNKPFILDLDKEPHILVLGMTGTGKTMLLYTMLTNIIYNDFNNVDVYIMQIVNAELSLFDKCKGVKQSCYNLYECYNTLNKIGKELDRRMEMLRKTGSRNVNEYNKKASKKLKRVILIIDEFSFFRPEQSDDEDTLYLKNNIESLILRIIKSGRSNNVNLISCLQRPTQDNINTTVRSQVSFLAFKLKINDSKLIFGDERANKLERQQFLFNGQTMDKTLKTYYIDEDLKVLKNYVPSIKGYADPQEDFKKVVHIPKDNKKPNTTVLEPMTIFIKNGKAYSNGKLLTPVEQKIPEQNYKHDILKFIQDFRAISTTQCAKLYYKGNNNNARRSLKSLLENKKLISYTLNNNTIYTFAGTTKLTIHGLIRNNFIVNFLLMKDIKVLEIKPEHYILNKQIRTDLYIKYLKEGIIKHLYVEVDDTHFTDNNKLKFLEEQLKVHTFTLVIIRKDIKLSKQYKYNIISLDPKKYTLNSLDF